MKTTTKARSPRRLLSEARKHQRVSAAARTVKAFREKNLSGGKSARNARPGTGVLAAKMKKMLAKRAPISKGGARGALAKAMRKRIGR